MAVLQVKAVAAVALWSESFSEVMRLSFVIPVYNEEENLKLLIPEIHRLENEGHEVIVVDGGSCDQTFAALTSACKNITTSDRGRAIQMNVGAGIASGDVLVFLHADTRLPPQAGNLIKQAIAQRPWGRFNVKLSGSAMALRIIAGMMNFRSCLTAIATGDQCLFVKKDLFQHVGGYEAIPLMEDISLSKSLKKLSRPFCVAEKVVTSSRLWETKGVLRTVCMMWFLRLAYFFGASPEWLYEIYYTKK